jgi:RND family efflux transporter MFP subunit
MKPRTLAPRTLAIAIAAAVLAGAVWLGLASDNAGKSAAATARPALAVQTVRPQKRLLPIHLEVNGNVAAWQEASLGAEVGGLRLAEVRAEVGDVVRQGQVLARFADDAPKAELMQARAALIETQAAAREAADNAARARKVQASGALSAQQIDQYLTAEATAKAHESSAQANVNLAELRLRNTRVLASDDGVISQRSPQATLGAVVAQGAELFRLIRRNRLEWRGEVTSSELARVRAGQKVTVTASSGAQAHGRVRMVAPTVDVEKRTALVYVDLPSSATRRGAFKPGMFAGGAFELGEHAALTVPRQALMLRDGFSYVFRIGPDSRVTQTKVTTGAYLDQFVEIRAGLDADATLVASGAGFLNDGDLVKVVDSGKAAR